MQVVVDPVEVNRSIGRSGRRELFRSEVIFSEQVVQFELAGVSGFSHPSFFGRELGQVPLVEGTSSIGALIGRADAVLFPTEHGVSAMGAPVTGFGFAASAIGWRSSIADFA